MASRPVLLLPLLLSCVVGSTRVQAQGSPDYTITTVDTISAIGPFEAGAVVMDITGAPIQGWSYGICHDAAALDLFDVTDGQALLAMVPDFNVVNQSADGYTVGVVLSFFGGVFLPPGLGIELRVGHYSPLIAIGETTELCPCTTLGSPLVEVIVVDDAGAAIVPATPCGVITVSDTMLGDVAYIVTGESSGGLIDSVGALRDALTDLGEDVAVGSVLSSLVSTTPRSIWVMNGTFPNNHVLSALEGDVLVGLIQAGIPIYFESSDAWGFDPVTAFSDFDGVYQPAVGDGDDSLQGLVGSTHAGASFDALSATYNQDSPLSDSTDQLVPSPLDLAGPDAGVIWSDSGSGGALFPYATGIYYNTDPGFGKVICCSFEFGGYGGDQTALAAAYSSALQIASTPGNFRRGDANGDGSFDISDAIFTLSELFTSGAASSCQDASDANDDGGFDVSDAVFTLSALFVSGAPAPPAPGSPTCGLDPSADGLDCAAYMCL